MNEALTTQLASQLVPASYAEKAMASLMQLHSELMDEKERRVDLFRRLMEREQALAELKMYVKILEEKMAGPKVEPVPMPAPAPQDFVPPVRRPAPAPQPQRVPPMPPQMPGRARVEGWKTW